MASTTEPGDLTARSRMRAVIADDERLLREQLQARLVQVWPELEICGVARDGLEAVDLCAKLLPDVVFLDIRMPGLTGIEAAREIVALEGWHGEIVFVTAYDEYAVTAFERGALDYLLKPVEAARLEQTVARLKRTARPAPAPSDVSLDALLAKLHAMQQELNSGGAPKTPMRWIQCGVGQTVRLVGVSDVLFFRSDEKYTRVQTREQEALIRTPIRELIAQLDPQQFWQIHRSAIVNLAAIESIQRDEAGRQRVSVRGHPEVLEVSRSFAHLFRQA